MHNPFFKNKGPFKIDKLLKLSGLKNIDNFKNTKIHDIKDLLTSDSKDITFFHSKKYLNLASKTKANFCITSDNLKSYLPKKCNKIIVDNVLITTAKITAQKHVEKLHNSQDISTNSVLTKRVTNALDEYSQKLKEKKIQLLENYILESLKILFHKTDFVDKVSILSRFLAFIERL